MAQLSPGPLSRSHHDLEGLKHCDNCHQLGNREIGPRCLDCHQEIAAMRRSGKGLHSGDEFAACANCHTEHQGENYDLVFWPAGQEAFDHERAGFKLTGRHAQLGCRQCHAFKYMGDPSQLRRQGKRLDRTYLGLSSECGGCHLDAHQGQFVSSGSLAACDGCHDTGAWKPASLFDHDQAAFALTGRHRRVDCTRCHPLMSAAGQESEVTTRRFRDIAFASCSSCHQDPHSGGLGPSCQQCHTTKDWRQVTGGRFDHDKTRYPLRGRHRDLACRPCHGENRRKPAFDTCDRCHVDAHEAASRGRPQLRRCENCHTVQGFQSSSYTLAQHRGTAFPLHGAHQAVSCPLCHKPLAAAATRASPYCRAVELVPEHQTCTSCHADPHDERTQRYAKEAPPGEAAPGEAPRAGCLLCHAEDSWHQVVFDHSRTRFPLEGRHSQVACKACHRPASGKRASIPFVGTSTICGTCHQDVHQGQFRTRLAADHKSVACDPCHVTTDWLAERFDHDRDSRFPLRGNHRQVACRGCHLPMSPDNDRLLHFKPVPVECRACHTDNPGKLEGRS